MNIDSLKIFLSFAWISLMILLCLYLTLWEEIKYWLKNKEDFKYIFIDVLSHIVFYGIVIILGLLTFLSVNKIFDFFLGRGI